MPYKIFWLPDVPLLLELPSSGLASLLQAQHCAQANTLVRSMWASEGVCLQWQLSGGCRAAVPHVPKDVTVGVHAQKYIVFPVRRKYGKLITEGKRDLREIRV